jgi:hypothetical protein
MAQSNAILFRMPFGIPGDLSRMAGAATVKAEIFGATAFPSYGIPVKLSAGTVIPVAAANDAVYGFLVRPFPTQGPNASDPLGTSVPPTSGIANVMLRGYIAVKAVAGVPAEGGAVYVWYAATSGNNTPGSVSATSVPGSNYVVPGCYFTGPADASGNAEIAFNL